MSSSKGRLILSWIVGIIIFFILQHLFGAAAYSLGLEIWYFFEGYEYDYFVAEDRFTPLGWFLFWVAIILASRIGMAINYGNFKDGTGKHSNLMLLVITTCLGAYALIYTTIWELFEREIIRYVPGFLYFIMEFGMILGIGYLGFNFYQNKIHRK